METRTGTSRLCFPNTCPECWASCGLFGNRGLRPDTAERVHGARVASAFATQKCLWNSHTYRQRRRETHSRVRSPLNQFATSRLKHRNRHSSVSHAYGSQPLYLTLNFHHYATGSRRLCISTGFEFFWGSRPSLPSRAPGPRFRLGLPPLTSV